MGERISILPRSTVEETLSKSISFPALKVTQPIGEFYIGVIDSNKIIEITWYDIRRIEGEREVETYLGIQRPLVARRVNEIKGYVKTIDACFPTGILVAVKGECAHYDKSKKVMTLSNYLEGDEDERIIYGNIAKVLDGQHRIEGLRDFNGKPFQLNVAIFVDIDIAEQAYVFSTVNLAQTKVNRSLVYDLFDLAKANSPQKLCHNIAVAFDQSPKSPFHQRIKRLGVSTEGRFAETITQATFVESLMKYLTKTPIQDRDIYKRGAKPEKVTAIQLKQMIFRNMMIDGREKQIADVVWNYFDAVRTRWPDAWAAGGEGMILNKTNGFRGLMRFLRPVYLYLVSPGQVPSKEKFENIFNRINLSDDYFSTDNFKPGTSGEGTLYRTLVKESNIEIN